MKGKVIYSVFPEQELDEVFTNLYDKYTKTKTSSQENLLSLVDEKDAKLLQSRFRKMPFVQVEDDDIEPQNYFVNNNAFNDFLNSLLENINLVYKAPKKEIDYFSKSLFEKVGNNNLDIKENTQSAGLLFSL